MVIWFISLILTTISLDRVIASSSISTPSYDYSSSHQLKQNDDIAIDIPGIELQLSPPNNSDDGVPIQVVYTNYTTTLYNKPSKGIVLLLHACSHSALKFFTPSPNCKSCIGLSEELRIVRLVLQYGYTPIAISSINRVNGCWSNKDIPRIETVLNYWTERNEHQKVKHPVIYAIGASSGGSFASQLLVSNMVDGALVMVMSLSNNVVKRLAQDPKPIYLAPMPRDTNTLTRCEQNYHDLITSSTSSTSSTSNRMKEYIRLDTTTCKSIPVTASYLVQRIPHMTMNHANHLIQLLKQANHKDKITNMLLVDPTKSNWRDILIPNKNSSTNNKSTYWLDLYDLTPGKSQLAKSLHRAWAYHEYCSEVVVPALRFFEEYSMR